MSFDPAQISFDPALPISHWRAEISAAIDEHQIVVIAGETGSGKTTQLPKICLQLGRRAIAHTQPRRIAARSVAERVAEELKTSLGELVGYQVRFTRKVGADTQLKIMTDGVLLAEISHDRDLRRYDTIIIDEAHERSLNIDFLLGYLKLLTARRPELKVIITSATIDTDRFATHFADSAGRSAPIIEVSGRTYPVELRYRPLLADGEADQVGGICAAIHELAAAGDGDILVFCSGEREIRDAADAVTALDLPRTEVLPLYARLSAAEQHRVFAPHPGRRIAIATNVAETSLTVPGIRYVIDPGTARISRYSARTKVQRLPIEPISQASANQRAGRCGRVAPGICIRLYDEEDFAARPEFTEPEMLRTNLAAVILRMAAADLGPISGFPFVEAPDNSQVSDGLRLLIELDALSITPAQPGTRSDKSRSSGPKDQPRLTEVGRQLAKLPLDPRLGRMLLAAERLGCLAELLVVVSGLSIQDPRERPEADRDRAAELHRRFWAALPVASTAAPTATIAAKPGQEPGRQTQTEPKTVPTSTAAPPSDGSDFVAYLRLWDYLRDQQRALSGNAFRRMCRDEYLHFLRVREWQDLHGQLRDLARELKWRINRAPAPLERVHAALLTGLLSNIGLADLRTESTRAGKPVKAGASRSGRGRQREYLGARGTRFAINPGSALAKSPPELVMAAEIVETSRLWARTVAPVTAPQIEEVGSHLLKHRYDEPYWSSRQAAVLASETVTLFGVPIVAGRRVSYGRVDPVAAREIFLQAALVEGRWRTRHRFFARNQELRADLAELEERTRRRDLSADDQVVYDFYDRRIPAGIVSGVHFDRWWKQARQQQPELLTMSMAELAGTDPSGASGSFPDSWSIGGQEFAISYRFAPGDPRDGASIAIPLAVLNQVDPAGFSWQVPGFRSELAAELVRTLPKATRRQLVPAPEYAERAVRQLAADQLIPEHIGSVRTDTVRLAGPAAPAQSFPVALAAALRQVSGVPVNASDFDLDRLPSHLLPTFVIVGADGELAAGKDLAALAETYAGSIRRSLTQAAARHTQNGATDWTFGTIAETVDITRAGHRMVGYPALIDEGGSVGLIVAETPERQAQCHQRGLRRLTLLQTPDPTRWVVSHLGNTEKLSLGTGPYESAPALLADARLASVGELIRQAGGPIVTTEAEFRRLCDTVRANNAEQMRAVVNLVARTLQLRQQVLQALPAARRVSPAAADDVAEQVGNLVFAGFVAATPYLQLTELPRYLTAANHRLQSLLASLDRDARSAATIARCEDAYAEACAAAPAGELPERLDQVGWLLEELRVSLFAQQLRTRVPVSERRVLNAIAAARAELLVVRRG